MGDLSVRGVVHLAHDLRIPINSILALSQILLGRLDGDLSDEQDKQLRLIQRSGEELARMVDEMLELARAGAGRITVRPSMFRVVDLFRALSGIFGPIAAQSGAVRLSFEELGDIPELHTDEQKVSQIMRNLVSNALKFTERGEVRVTASCRATDEVMVFEVRDTGIGIAACDAGRIFEQFTQVRSRLQDRFKGSGLGLPLSRELAKVLGGDIDVESEVGVGSTFRALIPATYRERAPASR